MELTKCFAAPVSAFAFAPLADEGTVNTIPKEAIIAVALLCALRIADLGFSFTESQKPKLSSSGAAWIAVPVEVKINAAQRRAQTAAPQVVVPPPEESLETQNFLRGICAAGEQQKKFVVFEFGANWSDPCKSLESEALVNPTVTRVLNDRFMPVRVRNLEKETGTNPRIVAELAKKYRVFAYPTLVVVDNNGKLVTSQIGNCSALSTFRFLNHSLAMANRK